MLKSKLQLDCVQQLHLFSKQEKPPHRNGLDQDALTPEILTYYSHRVAAALV